MNNNLSAEISALLPLPTYFSFDILDQKKRRMPIV